MEEFHFSVCCTICSAVSKSGTGTWDLGREDSGTPGRGTRGRGDAGTRGRGDAGTWDSGTRGRGDVGRGDVGLGDAGLGTRDSGTWVCEDVINKKHPNDPLNLQFTVFVI